MDGGHRLMAGSTTRLQLPYLAADQAQKHVTMNDSLRRLDALVQLSVIDRTTSTPPASPTDGDAYIIGPSPTGAWITRADQITVRVNGSWVFFEPITGWIAYDQDTATYVKWTGSAWINALPASGGSFGWHDYQDTATAGTPIALTAANTWYDLTNDGLGPLTDNTFAIAGHGEIWRPLTNRLNFSSLQVGDLLRIRTDITFTTSGANHKVQTRLAFGPSFANSVVFDAQTVKSAGDEQRFRYFSFTIKNTDTLNNPAKFQASSDATGDTVTVEGWQIETHRP